MNRSIYSTVVVSSRIRLARNVASYPFPNRFTDRVKAKELADKVYDSLAPLKENLSLYYMVELDPETKRLFQENYLISNTLIEHGATSAIITNPEGSISVMINEEDHIRAQFMGKGFSLYSLFERAMDIDENYIGKAITYARSPRFGLLTTCPTNVGTGLRASVMVFIPGIVKNGKFDEMIKKDLPEGLIIRGVNGEGSKGDGFLYQVSNERTLGLQEKDLVEKLEDFVKFLCEKEASERLVLKERDTYALKDSCGRAYGVLGNAEILPYEEFLSLLSKLKLGIVLGFYSIKDFELLNDLTVAMRDHNLEMWDRKQSDLMDGEEPDIDFSCDTIESKDVYRAQCVRQFIDRYLIKEN